MGSTFSHWLRALALIVALLLVVPGSLARKDPARERFGVRVVAPSGCVHVDDVRVR